MLTQQAVKIDNMMKELYRLTTGFLTLAPEEFERSVETIIKLKESIQSTRRELLDYISRLAPALLYKEEWLRLAFRFDDISDKIIGIVYRLEHFVNYKPKMPHEIAEIIEKIDERVLDIISTFRTALSLLLVDIHRSLNACQKVEELEKEIDHLYRRSIFTILDTSLPLRETMMLKEIAEMTETIADLVEKASNDLRIIIINLL
ncbi:MAG: hypothetical protein DRJ49_00475 [Thermoprotei archaeon]|nr:MAG: hypothetical protein DRJ49_00475 [Thermoprotei archaeon]RLG35838.1 MAG: hypothetical protein DRN91_09020 [Candidatus Alkanophagales archaeon]